MRLRQILLQYKQHHLKCLKLNLKTPPEGCSTNTLKGKFHMLTSNQFFRWSSSWLRMCIVLDCWVEVLALPVDNHCTMLKRITTNFIVIFTIIICCRPQLTIYYFHINLLFSFIDYNNFKVHWIIMKMDVKLFVVLYFFFQNFG